MIKRFESFLNLLFPPKCPCCGHALDEPGICASCRDKLPWTKGDESLRKGPDGFRCCAPLWYEDLGRAGILNLKFHGMSAAANPLGALITACAAEWFSGEFDTVTWVPVSRKRLRKRGYDQAELLARSACKAWGVKPVRLLKKRVHNLAQSTLSEASARRANVLGVYETVHTEQIAARRILLIDDVCTTGATLAECVRMLKMAGAESVVCAAVALRRTEKEREKAAAHSDQISRK